MKIKEVIVVEGKNDDLRLKQFFDCDTIITHGLGLDDKTIEMIKEMNDKRGVILFLDPDHPGEMIRKRLNDSISGLKNAFVLKKNARTPRKVGVEHASYEILKEALENLVTYESDIRTLEMEDMYDLGLVGLDDAAVRREYISEKYHIGKCNAKTMLKRLNMLKVKREELVGVLNERYSDSLKDE